MSEWISVEDRLPESSWQKEIVVWNGKWSRVGHYITGIFVSPHDEVLDGITHWMPLPEPPK